MIDKEQALEIIDKRNFFNDRAGRELWNDKPKEIQDEDIRNAHKEYEQLKEYVLNQPKVDNWIPVEERLPEEAGVYRVTCLYADKVYRVKDDLFYSDRNWGYDDRNLNRKVIAWKPIEEPYEVKENE